MGGAVSSGRDNNELIDNLKGSKYIRSDNVEAVFRAVDRGDYMLPSERNRAYKDLAWRSGALHMSAPCIYSEVMEALALKPGLTFLNVGSGTGYFSTLVGLMLGSGGISHGIEINDMVVEYANKRLKEFLERSNSIDELDFCEPKFYLGNALCLTPLQAAYDRVYCGAACPDQYLNYFRQLIKVGGILVMPLNDNLVKVQRVSEAEWSTNTLLKVSFATLRVPSDVEKAEHLRLEEQTPPRLQALSRARARGALMAGVLSRHPHLRPPKPREEAAPSSGVRTIHIPMDNDSEIEDLNLLHDLDEESGAQEMNALLNLVLSMGQNRVAGSLRFDPASSSEGSSGEDDGPPFPPSPPAPPSPPSPPSPPGPAPPADPPANDSSDDTQGFEQISRAIHRVIMSSSGAEPSLPRGRLSVTLEYDSQPRHDEQPSGSRSDPTPNRPRNKKRTIADNSRDLDDVDSDVEVDLPQRIPDTSNSEEMELEDSNEERKSSSEERSTCRGQKGKRQKFDSGIGEENSPSSGSPAKVDSNTDTDGRHSSDSDSSDNMDLAARRRRLPKRRRCETAPESSSDSESETTRGQSSEEAPRRHKRPVRFQNRNERRSHLANLIRKSIEELPLPYALKRYVNLDRPFQVNGCHREI